jgi:biotin carboxyl carrier protein
MKYRVIYKDNITNEIEFNGEQVLINGKPSETDLVQLIQDKFHILDDNRSYNIEVLHADFLTKTFEVKVNEKVYHLKLEDELDALLEKMGMSAGASQEMDDVKAPMPGLVLQVFVSEGQAVNKGDNLLVLEAMKMENIIKASGSGTVKAIKIKQKQAVEKNQLLIEME